jgi:hypothetical protein
LEAIDERDRLGAVIFDGRETKAILQPEADRGASVKR